MSHSFWHSSIHWLINTAVKRKPNGKQPFHFIYFRCYLKKNTKAIMFFLYVKYYLLLVQDMNYSSHLKPFAGRARHRKLNKFVTAPA